MAKDVKFNIKINVDGKDVIVRASTNVKELASNLGIVRDKATAADKAFFKMTQSVIAIDSITNSLRQVSGVLNTLTEDSRSFAGAMKAANTMAGKDAAGFAKLKSQVADLSKDIPMVRDELANGLYQVISNGVPEDNWIEFLNKSARSAVGGIADVSEVVKVTSTVIKNYGLEWSAAADIQDKIQLTAKNGVTSFEQLAAALPSVTGQAAQLGTSFTEMLAVMSTLTGVTGNTSEVATQLASVLTALTKESSKSQKMAEEMGISFNAASIKAAGGLRNFLQELDKTVTAYSQKTGQLKESIYSKLFGRAEALRLVNALTGEMAEKFDENIAALDNSAGTIDKVFNEMASTGGAVYQMLKNQFAAVKDVAAAFVTPIQPMLNFTAEVGMATLGVVNLVKGTKALAASQFVLSLRTKASGLAMLAFGLNANRSAAFTRVFSAALRSGAYSAVAFKIAIRGLMIATGIGALIAGVAYGVEKLVEAFDDAGNAAEEAADKITTVKDSAQQAAQVFENTQSETYSKLMTKYTQLQTAWKALSTAHAKAKWIKDNKKEFAELGIKINGVQDAEQVFTKNTGAVVQAFVARAKAAARLAQLTEEYRIQMDLADKIATADQAAQARHTVKSGQKSEAGEFSPSGHTTDGGYEFVGANGDWVYTDKGAAKHNSQKWYANSAQDKANRQAFKQSQDRTKRLEGEIANDAKTNKPFTPTVPTSDDKKGGKNGSENSDADVLKTNAKSYADLSHNISVYKKRLDEADPSNKTLINALREQIAAAEKAAQAAKDVANGWDIENPDTLEEIDEAINRQQALRKKANAENLQGVDDEIKRLQDLRNQIERNAKVPTPTDQIQTYEQLDEALSIYNDRLKVATAEERQQIQTQINELNKLRNKWDETLKAMEKPGDISTLNNISDLDDAISYYGELQKKQSADEISNTQLTIQALEAKRKALQRGIELPSMQKEIAEINALDGKEFKLKVSAIGFDALTEKINELKRQLNDVDHPVTTKQRKDIESMIETYESWRKSSISVYNTMQSGWDAIKGMGNSIQSLNDVIEGNGNAWQKTVAVIDAFIGLYDGINAVIGIIEMLTTATHAHTAAKTAEGVATGVTASATTAAAATETAAATAVVPVIVANKLATASYMELASAMYFAAHASIPFAGYGIAAGFSAAATAMVQAIGVTPFAKGGIVSGPTFALVGEYSGASNNPEVIAPLDKLRGMMQPNGGAAGGVVRFEIDGRKLVGVIANETRISSKSGKRTNIKL